MTPTGKDQWMLGFGINLPIWSRKLNAAEREARRGMLEGIADLSAGRNNLFFRLQDTLVKLETQQRLTILFRDVILPQAKQTIDASRSGYQAGKVDFLTLVDNWRKLLEFQMLYHRSLSQFEQQFAELRRLVGQDIQQNGEATEDGGDQPPEKKGDD